MEKEKFELFLDELKGKRIEYAGEQFVLEDFHSNDPTRCFILVTNKGDRIISYNETGFFVDKVGQITGKLPATTNTEIEQDPLLKQYLEKTQAATSFSLSVLKESIGRLNRPETISEPALNKEKQIGQHVHAVIEVVKTDIEALKTISDIHKLHKKD